jgi:hypothetical protein
VRVVSLPELHMVNDWVETSGRCRYQPGCLFTFKGRPPSRARGFWKCQVRGTDKIPTFSLLNILRQVGLPPWIAARAPGSVGVMSTPTLFFCGFGFSGYARALHDQVISSVEGSA